MKSIFPIICLAFIFSAEANQDKNKYWNWNKIAVSWFPGGDTIKSVSEVTLVNLQGGATVDIVGNKINIMIYSADWSDEPVKITGLLSESKIEQAIVYREDKVNGDYGLIGEYRIKKYSEKCTFEEIVLKSYNPDAEVHMLARSSSTCSLDEITENLEVDKR